MNLRVKELILNGESEEKTLYDIIADGAPVGMMTFDSTSSSSTRPAWSPRRRPFAYSSGAAWWPRPRQIKAARGNRPRHQGLAMEQKEKNLRLGLRDVKADDRS